MASWVPLLVSAFVSILGGGLLGHWLTHRRLSPKSKAEAREITAAAQDKDWARFHREIDRLVKRLETAEARAERAEKKAFECEETKSQLQAEIIQLRAYIAKEGQMRQDAAALVAAERLRDDQQRQAAR